MMAEPWKKQRDNPVLQAVGDVLGAGIQGLQQPWPQPAQQVAQQPIDPYAGLRKLTKTEQESLSLVLLHDELYGSIVAETLFQPIQGQMPKALDVGQAQSLIESWQARGILQPNLAKALEAIKRGNPSAATYKDIFSKAKISDDKYQEWQKVQQAEALAVQTGRDIGSIMAQIESVNMPMDESMVQSRVGDAATAITEKPSHRSNTLEGWQDLLDEDAGITDEINAALGDPDYPPEKLRALINKKMMLSDEIKELRPYFELTAAQKSAELASKRTEAYRQEQLGLTKAGQAQALAQSQARLAFDKEKERRAIMQFQEEINQKLRELTMQAAQLNVAPGTSFSGPYGDLPIQTTPVSIPQQSNFAAQLARAGAG